MIYVLTLETIPPEDSYLLNYVWSQQWTFQR